MHSKKARICAASAAFIIIAGFLGLYMLNVRLVIAEFYSVFVNPLQ